MAPLDRGMPPLNLESPPAGHPVWGLPARLRAGLAHLPPLRAAMGEALLGWVAGNFASAGRNSTVGRNAMPGGWPPLARETLRRRARDGFGTTPLLRTGRLRDATTTAALPDGLRLRNPVPYAPAHQFGLGVPARPFFPNVRQAAEIVAPIVAAHVATVIADATPATQGGQPGGFTP